MAVGVCACSGVSAGTRPTRSGASADAPAGARSGSGVAVSDCVPTGTRPRTCGRPVDASADVFCGTRRRPSHANARRDLVFVSRRPHHAVRMLIDVLSISIPGGGDILGRQTRQFRWFHGKFSHPDVPAETGPRTRLRARDQRLPELLPSAVPVGTRPRTRRPVGRPGPVSSSPPVFPRERFGVVRASADA